MKFWKKGVYIFNVVVLFVGLITPLVLFLNRFLIPDVSYDSLNYHLFLGQRGIDTKNNQYEFYPTGIHNFSPILEIPSYVLMKVFNYRIGSIGSLIFLYLSIWILYKIFRLYQPKYKILDHWWSGLLFVNIFLSFEAFLQIATYYVDIQMAFFSLLSIYWLLKYEKKNKLKYLLFSSLSLGVLFLGKMTGGYILPTCFGYLIIILAKDNKLNWKRKISRLILFGFIVLLFSIPFWWVNYQKTGNPIFPYYNSAFKSDFYSVENFTQDKSGGDNIFEKLFWGLVSINKPDKLGQVHDLFHDFKINIYFVTTLLVLVWAVIKKEKEMVRIASFYLVTYEIWAWVFGYLRYAIFLEFLGGIILLLWLTKLKKWPKWFVILPVFGVMFLQNKRVINLSLAYDISFRPGYFYNRLSYPKEIKNINIKTIKIDKSLAEKYQPKVFLNCASPDMSYYSLSDFSNLPVLNIDKRSYSLITDRQIYMDKQKELLQNKIGNEKVSFVTIAAKSGLNNFYGECIDNLKQREYIIIEEQETDFLGYEGQKLMIIFGEFNW